MGNACCPQTGGLIPRVHGDPKLDRALGCLLGVAVGDAAGAPMEHVVRPASAEMIEEAMHMPGTTRAGQQTYVTDDTELSIALARGGLLSCCPTRLP